MGLRKEPAWATAAVGLTMARERGDSNLRFRERLLMTRPSVERLGLEKELHGHMGCVNCLEWNHDGS